MQPEHYQAYLRALVQTLDAMPQVIGMVAAGSTASINRQPDAYSDHDFWVITHAGAAEPLRNSTDWLPPYLPIVVFYRETEHGSKIIFEDGHLIEYAVFERHQVAQTRVTDYRILIDKADLTPQLAHIHQHTLSTRPPRNTERQLAELISHLLVGVQRAARGETISAHRFVKVFALDDILQVLWNHLPPEQDYYQDAVDVFRRVEKAHPVYAARLGSALAMPIIPCAAEMLSIAEDICNAAEVPLSADAVRMLRAVLARVG